MYAMCMPKIVFKRSTLGQQILDLKNVLVEKEIIQKDSISYIHYPPHFYRLHIHFVDKNHKFHAPKEHIFYIEDVKNLFFCKI